MEKENQHLVELTDFYNELKKSDLIDNTSPAVQFILAIRDNFSTEYVSESISVAGYSAEDIMSGKIEFKSLIPEMSLMRLRQRFAEAMIAREDTYSLETQIRFASGAIHPYQNRYRIIKDEYGSPLFLLGISVRNAEPL
ncbi:PAS domain-containing protein [Pontiellaceae bacterium B12227]|nr:PAS domain-containing protein [Pontiellaceae bacterium B12227]